MPKVKLIAIDIDGTLVPGQFVPVSRENIDAINEARKKGIFVTLASGRIYAYLKKYVDQLNIDFPVIAANGADIRQNHQTIKNSPFDNETFDTVLEILKPFDLYTYYFSGDHIYLLKKDMDDVIYKRWDVVDGLMSAKETQPEILSAIRTHGVQKILVFPRTDGQELELKKELAKLGGKVNAVTGEKHNLEINAAGVSKAYALQYVAQTHGLTLDDVMAIGDSENDLEMLKAAGTPVAMGNADPVAKNAAKYIVKNSEDSGVADAIRRFALT